jgi:chitin synthase
MATTAFPAAEAGRIHTLTDLITSQSIEGPSTSPGPARTIYPNDDTVTALLAARARSEHPYVRLSNSGTDYVVVNPLRALGCLNEESRKGYEAEIEKTDSEQREGLGLQPSIYDLAGRVWLLMSRRKESQAVVYQWVSSLTRLCVCEGHFR